MSGSAADQAKPGPALPESVREVRGAFPNDAALQDAMARLTLVGFDRADLSLPTTQAASARPTLEHGAENPTATDDAQQARTLQTSLAASVGALAAAGAVIATGGAALPAVAAAAVGGIGLGGMAQAITGASDTLRQDARQEAAARDELVLSVRLHDPAKQAAAEQAMREAGAARVVAVTV